MSYRSTVRYRSIAKRLASTTARPPRPATAIPLPTPKSRRQRTTTRARAGGGGRSACGVRRALGARRCRRRARCGCRGRPATSTVARTTGQNRRSSPKIDLYFLSNNLVTSTLLTTLNKNLGNNKIIETYENNYLLFIKK